MPGDIAVELIVAFDPPFWVALLFVHRAADTRVYRHVFGAEPSDPEVREFVRSEIVKLAAGTPIAVLHSAEAAVPPSTAAARRHWVRNALERTPIDAALLAAVAEASAASKLEHGVRSRDARAETAAHAYAQRRESARMRHRGR